MALKKKIKTKGNGAAKVDTSKSNGAAKPKEKKSNGAGPTPAQRVRDLTTSYRGTALAHVEEEGGTPITRAEMLAFYEGEDWTDEEHAKAWEALCAHEGGRLVDTSGEPEPEPEYNRALVDVKGDEDDDYDPHSHELQRPDDDEEFERIEAEADGEKDSVPPALQTDNIDPYAPKRNLECPLSKDEIDAIREDREEGDAEIEQLTSELNGLQERAKKVKKRIDVLVEEGLEASKRIRVGVEYRMVACAEKRGEDPREDSPTKGKWGVITIRLDTNEVIEWRELRRDELQGNLFDAPTEATAPASTPTPATELPAAQV